MDGIKIIHCADLHLGAPFSAIPDKAAQRQKDQIQTLNKIVELSNAIQADILLIAGDLFDSPFVSDELFSAVTDAFRRLDTAVVFIASGNHDPAGIDSVYKTKQWPENVGLFTGALQCYELENLNVRVWGCGFTEPYAKQPLAESFSVPDDSYINIMLLHGDKISNGQGSVYNPITDTFIRDSGMQYIAMGHIHTATKPQLYSGTRFAYSGSPEPLGFDETGAHGVLVLCLNKQEFQADLVKLSCRSYYNEDINVASCTTQNDIAQLIQFELNRKHGDSWKNNLYRVCLKGMLPLGFAPSVSDISARLDDDVYYIRVEDATTVKANMELLSKETSLRGAFVRNLLNQRDECSANGDAAGAQKCIDALNIGLRAFEGEVTLYDN